MYPSLRALFSAALIARRSLLIVATLTVLLGLQPRSRRRLSMNCSIVRESIDAMSLSLSLQRRSK